MLLRVLIRRFFRQKGEADALRVPPPEKIDHDIGIKKAEELYHASNGRLQQELGPGEAEIMLKELHFPEDVIERVKYLIAHHHTYSNIQGIDLQILIEADFLVNLYEHSDESVASKVLEKIFKTASGTKLCKTMFRL